MARFVVRVWVPDRPGALGQVASRIGAVKADVVGIEILERGGGRAVDDLIVDVSDPDVKNLLVSEIGQVDGVDVEDIREATAADVDPDLDALARAGDLIRSGRDGVGKALAELVAEGFGAEWVALVQTDEARVHYGWGEVPNAEWLVAFAGGASASVASGAPSADAADVAYAPLTGSSLVLAVGRAHPPIRLRERRRIHALADIAGAVVSA